MRKAILTLAVLCGILVTSCRKPKEECTLNNYIKTEWQHNNGCVIDFSHGMHAYVNPPIMYLYNGQLDDITDNQPDGLYHYGNVEDLCSIEKAPKNGWHDGVRLGEGHGYILRHTDDDGTNHYCRFILKEWIRDTAAKGIEDDPNGPDTTVVGIHLLIDNEWDGM